MLPRRPVGEAGRPRRSGNDKPLAWLAGELRIDDLRQLKEWRIMYCVGRTAIAVLEVFQKTTRATRPQTIAACRRRADAFRKVDGP